MSNPAPTPGAPGPLARQVLAALHEFRRHNVIDLRAWQTAQRRTQALAEAPELADLDPLHGFYAYAHNQLGALVEQLADLPMLAKLTAAYAEAEDLYTPAGPPISPLTRSYFSGWGLCDLGVGAQRESYAGIALAVCRALGTEATLLAAFDILSGSRMGLYRHEGHAGRYVVLTELVTQRTCQALSPSGYTGRRGELWFARVLPSIPPLGDYALVFTTPYCRRVERAVALCHRH
jgi:hypothetical protein